MNMIYYALKGKTADLCYMLEINWFYCRVVI